MSNYTYDFLKEEIVDYLGVETLTPQKFTNVLDICLRFIIDNEEKFTMKGRNLDEAKKKSYAWEYFIKFVREKGYDLDTMRSTAPSTETDITNASDEETALSAKVLFGSIDILYNYIMAERTKSGKSEKTKRRGFFCATQVQED